MMSCPRRDKTARTKATAKRSGALKSRNFAE